ncbi:hypothetical protein MPTK1_5g06110 [Marchantia polymorpha subsp. ruderalis]|uniref:Uncharacterized protein n=2 Tax=Marchantia polymorpha TaxID=3197 RepID=A0AAF6BFG6_MARPO|nr:hypothetical protein MARPO_0027s0017 [Marchantia polymorpha]BBN10750.1 hypothetical protein Mp_5g06110 [Marchantia polymorpha subsp. ruderalis]|eukprot:PTQ42884.1 hypothetical protein MARPO_0027s0017 [Marchantia polymorpha]
MVVCPTASCNSYRHTYIHTYIVGPGHVGVRAAGPFNHCPVLSCRTRSGPRLPGPGRSRRTEPFEMIPFPSQRRRMSA